MSTAPRILKSGSTADMLVAGQFNYEDLRQRCELYLESVQKQSRQMLLDAQTQVEQLKKQAAEQGRKQGLAEGLKQADQQIAQRVEAAAGKKLSARLTDLVAVLKQATSELEQERRRCLSRWEGEALQLIMAVCEKLTHETIRVDPAITRQRLAELLPLTLGSSQITIFVSEQDLDKLGPQLGGVVETLTKQANTSLVASPELQPGDFLVQTDQGEIDARIQEQLATISRELLGVDGTK